MLYLSKSTNKKNDKVRDQSVFTNGGLEIHVIPLKVNQQKKIGLAKNNTTCVYVCKYSERLHHEAPGNRK